MKYLNKFNEGNSKWYDYAIDDIKASYRDLPLQKLIELKADITDLIAIKKDKIWKRNRDEQTPMVISDEIKIKFEHIPVSELEHLSVRSKNCLIASGYKTIGDLFRDGRQGMLKHKNFGMKSFDEINNSLEKLTGIKL